jgi:hypothetical protein
MSIILLFCIGSAVEATISHGDVEKVYNLACNEISTVEKIYSPENKYWSENRMSKSAEFRM